MYRVSLYPDGSIPVSCPLPPFPSSSLWSTHHMFPVWKGLSHSLVPRLTPQAFITCSIATAALHTASDKSLGDKPGNEPSFHIGLFIAFSMIKQSGTGIIIIRVYHHGNQRFACQ